MGVGGRAGRAGAGLGVEPMLGVGRQPRPRPRRRARPGAGADVLGTAGRCGAAGPPRLAPGARPSVRREFGPVRRAVRPKGSSRAARPEIRDLGSLSARPPPVRPAPRPASAGGRERRFGDQRPVDLGGGVCEASQAQLPDLPAVTHDEGRAPKHGTQRMVDAPGSPAASPSRRAMSVSIWLVDPTRFGEPTSPSRSTRSINASTARRSPPRIGRRGGAGGGRSGRRRTHGGPPVVQGSGRARRVRRLPGRAGAVTLGNAVAARETTIIARSVLALRAAPHLGGAVEQDPGRRVVP